MNKLRRVNVFERKPSVRSEALSAVVSSVTNAVTASDGSVWVSTKSGDIQRIEKGMRLSSCPLPGFQIVRGLRATKNQVVVWGRDGEEEKFRAFHLYKLSPGGAPTKLRDAKISAKATAFDVSPTLSWAALGLETGQVLLSRGGCDFHASVGFQGSADKRPITALTFVDKDSKSFLFVCTEISTIVFSIALDGTVTKEILDQTIGVSSQSAITRSGSLIFAATETALFTLDPIHGNISMIPREPHPVRGLFAWRGFCGEASNNVSIFWSHGVSRFLAFTGSFSSVIAVVPQAFDGRSVIVIEASGDVTEIVEHSIADQLKLLAKKHLYEIAIDLASREHQSLPTLADLHKMQADHLLETGNFDGAIGVFKRAFDCKLPVEISHVVRKCLNRPGVEGINAIIEFLKDQPALTVRTQELVIACLRMTGDSVGLKNFLASLRDDELVNHASEEDVLDLIIARADSSPQLFLPILSARGQFDAVADRLLKLNVSEALAIFRQITNPEELVVSRPDVARRFPEADRVLMHAAFVSSGKVVTPDVLDYDDNDTLLTALEIGLRAKDSEVIWKCARLAVTKGLAGRVVVLANMFGNSEIAEFAAKATSNGSAKPVGLSGRSNSGMGILRIARSTPNMTIGEVKEALLLKFHKSEKEVADKSVKISEDLREIQKMSEERDALLSQSRAIHPQNKQCFECNRNLLESSLMVYFNCGHNYHVHCATADLKDPPVCRVCAADAAVKKKLMMSRIVSCTKDDEMIKYLTNADNKFAVIANYAGRGLFASSRYC